MVGKAMHGKTVKVIMFSVEKCLLGLATGVVLLASGPVMAQERVLRITNWAEYIGGETIANFEAEYGIKVIYDHYDSVEAIDSKLLAGNSGYDVVSHSATQIARLIPAGILQPLDKSRLDNFSHMAPEVMAQLAAKADPGNNYIVPYMWGTHGVTYNADLVRETYPDAPIGSLDLVFDQKHMREIAKCGVSFLDSPTDVVPMALTYLGYPPDSTDRKHYREVSDLFASVRPYIKTFDNYAYQRMPEGEFCVSITFGPDGLLAIAGAEEAGADVNLDFFLPGQVGAGRANLWVDGWVIPADAENVEDAHLFLNYMMRPEVAAGDSNQTWYATANRTARDQNLIDGEVTSSPAAFPPPDQVAVMYTLNPLTPRMERIRTRVWTDFKAGN